jgi:hypothetical protein
LPSAGFMVLIRAWPVPMSDFVKYCTPQMTWA